MNLFMQETRPLPEDTRLIPLTQEQFALVDAADYDWLMQWRWHASWSKDTKSYYALNGAAKMHRLILGLESGNPLCCDHINHDTLDNRRKNLRCATRAQNQQNVRLRSDNKSGCKGVYWQAHAKMWRVTVVANGKRYQFGYFKDLEEAKTVCKRATKELHGQFATTEKL